MPESPQRHASFADCLELLKAFNQNDAAAVVVGGQAVNFWAEMFADKEPELTQFRPFTSADLDLHVPDASSQRVLRARAASVEAERDPFGKAFTIVSHTFLIKGKRGNVLAVDSLKMVAGLLPREIIKGSVSVEFAGATIRVLNPITCLKAKLCNLRELDQRGRQDEKHVRILIPCVRAFIRRLLTEAEGHGNYRPALNALKQLLPITSNRDTLRIARSRGLDLAQTAPFAELAASRNVRIVNFMTKQLPKWQRALERSV